MKNFNKAKYLVLILENCDEIIISFKDIVEINLDNIVQNYHYVDNGFQQIFQKMLVINTFSLILKPTANKTHKQFGQESEDSTTTSVFDRLNQYHDITSIKFLDSKYKELECFFVPYKEPKNCEGSLGAPNILQKTKIYKDVIDDSSKKVELLKIQIVNRN